VADKPVKAKQPEKSKPAENTRTAVVKAQQPEKPKAVQAKVVGKEKKEDKEKTQPKKPNRIVRWYRETVGELRKVSWPTLQEARRLTTMVVIVTTATSLFLGLIDFLFSRLIGLLVSL
jgi:preprotein translocase subunit SecE